MCDDTSMNDNHSRLRFGFSVPANRYFRGMLFVRSPRDHIALHGRGTMRLLASQRRHGMAFNCIFSRSAARFRTGRFSRRQVVETALKIADRRSPSELDRGDGRLRRAARVWRRRANKGMSSVSFLTAVRRKFERLCDCRAVHRLGILVRVRRHRVPPRICAIAARDCWRRALRTIWRRVVSTTAFGPTVRVHQRPRSR